MCPTWSLWVWLNMFWNTGWCVHTFLHVDLTRATNPRITKDFRMNHSLVTWVGGESTFSHDFSNPLFPTFQPLKCDFLSKSTVQNQILNGFWAEFLRKPEFCGAYPWCCWWYTHVAPKKSQLPVGLNHVKPPFLSVHCRHYNYVWVKPWIQPWV